MGFLVPGFLIGALAAAVPIYLHLLRRNTSTPLPFSSLMFFERRPQSAVERRRLRYWLLLALRLGVLLLLALAFAEPYLDRALPGMIPEKLLLVIVDDSFSMRAGTRLADAKQQALALVSRKRSEDRVQVLVLGAQAHVLTQPTREMRTLRSAIEGIQPSDSRGSFGTLAAVVSSIAEGEHVPVEVHLFSDLQKSGMPPSFSQLALHGNISLQLHAVATAAAPNWTVESVAAPRRVWDPRTTHIQAVIAGYGTPAAARTVSFIINGKTIATRRVEVPAAGRATAEIDSVPLPYGFSRGSVRIDPADVLAADDEFLFAIDRADRKRGLFVHQSADTRSPLFFGTAVAAAAQNVVALDSLTVEAIADVDPSQYAFVVLSDVAMLPTAFADRLLQYTRRGGSVLVAVGTAAAQGKTLPLFGGSILGLHYYSKDPEHFAAVGEANAAQPTAGSPEEWEGVRFYYAAAVDEQGARVAVRLQDRTPLVLEKSIGEGRVVLFASAFDNLTNDLPVHPVFVAFVERAVRYLSGAQSGGGSRLVDDLIELRTQRERNVAVDVIDPAGHRGLSLQDSTSAQSYAMSGAGFYEVRLADGRQDLIAANPDRRESDLAPIPADVLALWRGAGPAVAAAVAAPGTSRPGVIHSSLWWYAIWAALAFALAESAIGSRYLGTPRDEP